MPETTIQTETNVELRSPKLWTVTIMNDDFTPMDFVIEILMGVFRKSEQESEEMTIRVHHEGKAVVGIYTKDVATTRVERAMLICEREKHPLELRAEAAE